jgi:hypothetical protein
MKFVKRARGYGLLDYRRNEDILELKVYLIEKKLEQYKQKYLNYVSHDSSVGIGTGLRAGRSGF